MSVALRIALREFRAGISGFLIFLLCLALGVAAIASVGSIRKAIEEGLTQGASEILGGDAEVQFTYRFATEAEQDWLRENTAATSEIVDFRSMLVSGEERVLVQVKGVDSVYPIYGTLALTPETSPKEALRDNGLVAERILVDRLGLEIGDEISLGRTTFRLAAVIENEPDRMGGGFGFGPRVIVRRDALHESGLLAEGTLFNSKYRMKLAPGANLEMLKSEATALFGDTGLRWRDRTNGTPGIGTFVDRLGAFLVLVGLAGLTVGGVGVSASVRSYLERKTATIATLKTLGATGRTIFLTYLIQISLLALVGITIGLILGAGVPAILGPILADQLPVPALFDIYAAPLAEAAIYGLLTALIFSIWPLARAHDIRPSRLYRDAIEARFTLPRPLFIVLTVTLIALLIGLAAWFSGVAKLALWSAFGICAALIVLIIAAFLVQRGAKRLAGARIVQGRPALRLALASIGGPGGETTSVILSLGLGLAVLATMGQIDANLRKVITDELPGVAPAYFFVDIQNQQLDPFLSEAHTNPGVQNIETAPMLRGIITRVNGRPANEVWGDHWILSGDRGVSYSAELPKDATLTQGDWWPQDYSGPPLVSFADEEARELGLTVGDNITVNILGRDIDVTVANLRIVDFRDMGINFVMIVNPGALAGAPHSHIATVYAEESAEGPLLRALSKSFPNVTAIRVKDAISRVTDTLNAIASATSWGASATLLTGFIVLIGASAAGERRRVYEASILKTLGATRARILASFALRSAIMGAAAGSVALLAGVIAGWAVITQVMDAEFTFEPISAILIVAGGAFASLITGLLFALRPLAARPARILRSND